MSTRLTYILNQFKLANFNMGRNNVVTNLDPCLLTTIANPHRTFMVTLFVLM